MIIQVEGDILLTQAQALVQGVGVNDPMDKGLALQLRNKYPLLAKDFDRWCHQHDTQPGEAWLWNGSGEQRIVCLITHENSLAQENHYYKATLHHLKQSLDSLKKLIIYEKVTSIAVPKLGTGLGDLDWDDVLPLLEEQLGSVDIPVFIYANYIPGKFGQENCKVNKA